MEPEKKRKLPEEHKPLAPWKQKLHEVIFEADTPAGKLFDIILLVLILASMCIVMAESIHAVNLHYGPLLRTAEWVLTILFSLEYVLRLLCVKKPLKYVFSFFGVVDLLSILPTYLGLFIRSSHFLSVIRALRLLRIFRIFKLTRFVRDSNTILISLRKSRHKIVVFLFFIVLTSIILGSMIYAVENEVNPAFSSIPQSIYWAIVTLSTVGYGDIAPVTPFGKVIASVIMIIGYSIIAVPTGIITAEMGRSKKQGGLSTQACPSCSREGHDTDAKYCKYCGYHL
ncbi:MAG: ion transporter [Bacteroidia bacterium]|nr:ion transporter [Bacteroidia bacterium]